MFDHFSPDLFLSIKHNTITDEYHIIKLIGSGAFGKILHIRNKRTGINRALKVIKKSVIFKKK